MTITGVVAILLAMWGVAGCGSDADEVVARPGQRRQTDGPAAVAERAGGERAALRPARGLLRGVQTEVLA